MESTEPMEPANNNETASAAKETVVTGKFFAKNFNIAQKLLKTAKNIWDNRLVTVPLAVYAWILTLQNISNPVGQRVNFVDPGIYQYIGHLMTLGKMPYKDVFDHKGPLLYIINAIGYLIHQNHGIYFIELLFMIAVLAVSYLFLRRFLSKTWSLILCAFVYSDFTNCYTRGNMPDYYALLFLMIALYFLSDYYLLGKISKKGAFIIGLCGACTFWLKQTTAVMIFFLCLCIALDCVFEHHIDDIYVYILYFILGFLPVTILLCGWILLGGAWLDFIQDYFTFNFANGSGGISALSRALTVIHFATGSMTVLIWLLLVVYILVRLSSARNREAKEIHADKMIPHCVLALIALILVQSMPGVQFDYYQINFIPALVAVAGVTLYGIQKSDLPELRVLSALFASVALVMIVIPNLQKIPSNCKSLWSTNSEAQEIIRIIQKFSDESDAILIPSGSDSGYYLASGRESAAKYMYVQGALRYDRAFLESYSQVIKESKPAVILWRNAFMSSENAFFKNNILDNYFLVSATDNHKIYVLKESMANIQTINQIDSYLEELAKENYTALFAVRDIQGYAMTEKEINGLKKLGFDKANILLEHQYHNFIGVYEDGKVNYQYVGGNEASSYTGAIGKAKIEIESATLRYGNRASIRVNGQEYAVNGRGINIVVLDQNGDVVDSVAFDTHVKEMTCLR